MQPRSRNWKYSSKVQECKKSMWYSNRVNVLQITKQNTTNLEELNAPCKTFRVQNTGISSSTM